MVAKKIDGVGGTSSRDEFKLGRGEGFIENELGTRRFWAETRGWDDSKRMTQVLVGGCGHGHVVDPEKRRGE